jgi:hypothetical protein
MSNLLSKGSSNEEALKTLKKGLNPWCLLLVLTIFYVALLFIVEFIDFQGKAIIPIKLGKTMRLTSAVAAGLSLMTVVSLFNIFALSRIMIRKAG